MRDLPLDLNLTPIHPTSAPTQPADWGIELRAALWIEWHKAMRSRMPLFTALAFLLMPLIDAFFMIILRDPEAARQAGLITAKAQLMAGTADWPTYLSVLAQAIAVGGIFLFSLITTWVFGREFVDGTVKDWLAVPVARGTLILAKFMVTALWSLTVSLLVYGVALLLGACLGLDQATWPVILQGSITIGVTTLLIILVMLPVAWFAGVGHGYLLPLGVTILLVIFANVLAVAGWGDYFPWAIPALYAGAAGDGALLAPVSVAIVLLTSLIGISATLLWWQRADHHN